MQKINTRKLVESAIFIALATVLSFVQIPMPFGGGLTACSMLPLVIISFRYGWRWGAVTAFIYSVVQLVIGASNVGYADTFVMAVGIVFLDYIIAFTIIGFAGVADRVMKSPRAAVVGGIVVTFCLRFVCHLISGAWIWGVWMPDEFMGMAMTNPWVYSFLYNGWYMLGEIVLTAVVTMLIYKPLEKYFRGTDLK